MQKPTVNALEATIKVPLRSIEEARELFNRLSWKIVEQLNELYGSEYEIRLDELGDMAAAVRSIGDVDEKDASLLQLIHVWRGTH